MEVNADDFTKPSVTVRDNGHGIPHQEVPALFGRLGDSWKVSQRSKTKSRFLHGKEGKGRFKALALGRVSQWKVTYLEGKETLRYKVVIIRDNLVEVSVTAPEVVDPATRTGVEVKITELDRYYRSLEGEQAVQPLSEIFALYLTDYPTFYLRGSHEAEPGRTD